MLTIYTHDYMPAEHDLPRLPTSEIITTAHLHPEEHRSHAKSLVLLADNGPVVVATTDVTYFTALRVALLESKRTARIYYRSQTGDRIIEISPNGAIPEWPAPFEVHVEFLRDILVIQSNARRK